MKTVLQTHNKKSAPNSCENASHVSVGDRQEDGQSADYSIECDQELRIWRRYVRISDPQSTRNDYRSDPAMGASGLTLRDGSTPINLFAWISEQVPNLTQLLATLRLDPKTAREPELCSLPDELFFELVALGEPVDRIVSQFSASLCFDQHHDIARSGFPAIVHYLRWGHGEPTRRMLGNIRSRSRLLRRDAAEPILLICPPDPLTLESECVAKEIIRQAGSAGMTPVLWTNELNSERFLDGADCADLAAILTGDLPVWQLRAFAGELPQEVVGAVDLSGGTIGSLYSECAAAQVPVFAAPMTVPKGSGLQKSEELLLTYAQSFIFPYREIGRAWQKFGKAAGILIDDIHLAPPAVFRPNYGSAVEARASENKVRRKLAAQFGEDWSARPLVLATGPLAEAQTFRVLSQSMKSVDFSANFLWVAAPEIISKMSNGSNALGCNDFDETYGISFAIWRTPSLLNALAGICSHFISLRDSAEGCSAVLVAANAGAQVAICGPSSDLDLLAGDDCFEKVFSKLPEVDIFGLRNFLMSNVRRARAPVLRLPDLVSVYSTTVVDVVRKHLRDVSSPVSIDRFNPVVGEFEKKSNVSAQRRSYWRTAEECRAAISQSDNWLHKMLTVADSDATRISHESAPYALHHHVFYPDEVLATVNRYLESYKNARRVIFTVPSAESAARLQDELRDTLETAEIVVTPNIGRDVLPFLRELYDAFSAEPKLWWGHIHHKRSTHLTNGSQWREHLFKTLLGKADFSETCSKENLSLGDEELGLIAPLCSIGKSWGRSEPLLHRVAGQFPKSLPDEPLLFPAGNMFFCRGAVAKAMLDIFGFDYPWPEEPLPLDGSEYHLIERLWPAVAAQCGYRSVFLEFFNLQ